jgi:hypothetical protein
LLPKKHLQGSWHLKSSRLIELWPGSLLLYLWTMALPFMYLWCYLPVVLNLSWISTYYVSCDVEPYYVSRDVEPMICGTYHEFIFFLIDVEPINYMEISSICDFVFYDFDFYWCWT